MSFKDVTLDTTSAVDTTSATPNLLYTAPDYATGPLTYHQAPFKTLKPMWVMLTLQKGDLVLVDMNTVKHISQTSSFTEITMYDGSFTVQDTLEAILDQLKGEKE